MYVFMCKIWHCNGVIFSKYIFVTSLAVITDGYIVLSFQVNKLNYVYFSKRAQPVDYLKKWEKLANLEPKVHEHTYSANKNSES